MILRCPECEKLNKKSKVYTGIYPVTRLTVCELLIKYKNYISYTCSNNHSWFIKK